MAPLVSTIPLHHVLNFSTAPAVMREKDKIAKTVVIIAIKNRYLQARLTSVDAPLGKPEAEAQAHVVPGASAFNMELCLSSLIKSRNRMPYLGSRAQLLAPCFRRPRQTPRGMAGLSLSATEAVSIIGT
mmetsp:Transcript_11961/g.29625  ORF Transcript_11961/g.29625 Transcript_11961/m.29625 type:complete len:129 (+) Transcript_11961:1552-1938(+)